MAAGSVLWAKPRRFPPGNRRPGLLTCGRGCFLGETVALLDAAQSLSEAPTDDPALTGILRALARSTRADALALLAAGEGDTLELASEIGLSPAARGTLFRPREHPRLARAIDSARPVRFHDPREPD